MDNNSPIYREKYLKYKKKYMELKNFESDQEGGAWWSSDPTKKHNNQMKTLLKAEITKATASINPFIANKKGLESAQKKEIMKEYVEMTTVTLPGLIKENTEVKPNNENPDAVVHLKELMDSKLNNLSLSEWAVGKGVIRLKSQR